MATPARLSAAGAALDAWLGSSAERRSLRRVGAYAVVTRLLFWAITHYVVLLAAPRLHPRSRSDFGMLSTLGGWLRWDSWWYITIVEKGYTFTRGTASSVAFLPGYPAFSFLFTPLFGHAAIASLVAANLAFVASVIVLWDWVRQRSGVAAAERAAVALLLYPLSFFMNMAYAEAPFFLWCMLAIRSADRNAWRSAAVFGCLATVTRPAGIFLVPAFAWTRFRGVQVGRPPRYALWAVWLPVVALFLYALYLWERFGTPFAMLEAQQAGWDVGRSLGLFELPRRLELDRSVLDVFQLALPIVLAILVARCFRLLGPTSGIYAMFAAGIGILLGGESLGREALAVVPAFAVSGMAQRSLLWNVVLSVCGFVLLMVFVYAFVMGRFMG